MFSSSSSPSSSRQQICRCRRRFSSSALLPILLLPRWWWCCCFFFGDVVVFQSALRLVIFFPFFALLLLETSVSSSSSSTNKIATTRFASSFYVCARSCLCICSLSIYMYRKRVRALCSSLSANSCRWGRYSFDFFRLSLALFRSQNEWIQTPLPREREETSPLSCGPKCTIDGPRDKKKKIGFNCRPEESILLDITKKGKKSVRCVCLVARIYFF